MPLPNLAALSLRDVGCILTVAPENAEQNDWGGKIVVVRGLSGQTNTVLFQSEQQAATFIQNDNEVVIPDADAWVDTNVRKGVFRMYPRAFDNTGENEGWVIKVMRSGDYTTRNLNDSYYKSEEYALVDAHAYEVFNALGFVQLPDDKWIVNEISGRYTDAIVMRREHALNSFSAALSTGKGASVRAKIVSDVQSANYKAIELSGFFTAWSTREEARFALKRIGFVFQPKYGQAQAEYDAEQITYICAAKSVNGQRKYPEQFLPQVLMEAVNAYVAYEDDRVRAEAEAQKKEDEEARLRRSLVPKAVTEGDRINKERYDQQMQYGKKTTEYLEKIRAQGFQCLTDQEIEEFLQVSYAAMTDADKRDAESKSKRAKIQAKELLAEAYNGSLIPFREFMEPGRKYAIVNKLRWNGFAIDYALKVMLAIQNAMKAMWKAYCDSPPYTYQNIQEGLLATRQNATYERCLTYLTKFEEATKTPLILNVKCLYSSACGAKTGDWKGLEWAIKMEPSPQLDKVKHKMQDRGLSGDINNIDKVNCMIEALANGNFFTYEYATPNMKLSDTVLHLGRDQIHKFNLITYTTANTGHKQKENPAASSSQSSGLDPEGFRRRRRTK